MADSRFFSVCGPFKLAELAHISGAVIERDLSNGMKFLDILPLSTANKNNASFFNNRRYLKDFQSSNAGAIILDPSFVSQAPPEASLLTSRNPYLAYAKLTHAFYPEKILQENVHAGAFIDPSAKIGKSVMIDAGVIIKENVEIGDFCSISGNTFIGAGVKIGDNNIISSNISITHCIMGSSNILHAGASIGQDGFGFAPNLPNHKKVLQLGRVIIGNDVEIGANTSIDRGSGPDTVIGDGTKIDNLV
ncbi:MAG: UDP-3-O-(3-hydroxymyristoyl)glucosamine N-acyltransferase, partial [Rhodospirillaceae bacterium]|nr:UDP-3-O-(3-hydroxymyristoyl)glucosamine N-acyltransferase [Rhodospirillaceae bacterium]